MFVVQGGQGQLQIIGLLDHSLCGCTGLLAALPHAASR